MLKPYRCTGNTEQCNRYAILFYRMFKPYSRTCYIGGCDEYAILF